MEEPIRVLLVEHRHEDCRVAHQLLTDYDLDFTWRSVASQGELHALADDFHPDIVLCADDSSNSSHSLLGALRLLCSHTPVILISNVREADGSVVCDAAALLRSARRLGTGEAPGLSVGAAPTVRHARNRARLRRCFASLLESSTDPIVMSDSDGCITYANTSACRLLDGSYGRSLGTLCEAADPCLRSRHWLDIAHDSYLGRDQYSGPFAATPSSPSLEVAHRLAYFDHTIGHPTLVHINDAVGRLSAGADGNRTTVALVVTNLDSERISDEAGARRAGTGDDKPMNFGSLVGITEDDFLLALPPPCCSGDAAMMVQRVIESITRTTPLEGKSRGSSAQRGHIVHQDGPSDRGRPRSHTRDEALQKANPSHRLEMALGDALERRALSVQYQPQYELDTGRGCGVEALVRWVLSSGKIVSPSIFIPVAERAGMIHELGAWVLQSACMTAAAWCRRAGDSSTLSVNVSALQIDERFCTLIGDTLKQSGFPAKQLELEITESALIANTALAIEYLKEWKRLGVRIAVDDFGTGYSSLSYLSRLPVDRLKLDRSLIQMMTLSSKGAAVIRSVVSLGADLDIDVLAEGVETEQQLQMLVQLGCPRAQGFLLGRPMSATQAQVALKKAWGNRPAPDLRPMSLARTDRYHGHPA